MGSEVNWLSSQSTSEEVQHVLQACHVLEPGETVQQVTVAGNGNMNCVLRVAISAPGRTVILKQSRPWVEKYPTIAAPVERIDFETRFYQCVAVHRSIADRLPKMLGSLPAAHVLVLEDLGALQDATYLYESVPNSTRWASIQQQLVDWLALLHSISAETLAGWDFSNRALRELNHAHLFAIPFADPPLLDLNGLTPGLAAIAAEVRRQVAVVKRCAELGELYLAGGSVLLHGDFFPGSWILTARGEFVIDPEFCFLGCREFDLGILIAHCRLIDPVADTQWLVQRYESVAGARLEPSLVQDFAAMEILRRLLGVAQLPLTRSLDVKRHLIQRACDVLGR